MFFVCIRADFMLRIQIALSRLISAWNLVDLLLKMFEFKRRACFECQCIRNRSVNIQS